MLPVLRTPKLMTALADVISTRFNKWHIALWVLVCIGGISRGKAPSRQAMGHFHNETFDIRTPDGRFASCEANPAFCNAFAVGPELRLWLDSDKAER